VKDRDVTMKAVDPIAVVIVDDSAEFVRAACAWLESQAATRLAGTASGGREAVLAVERFAPDLVLMDVFMLDMDGFETTRRIKNRPGAPVVILFSVSDGSAMEQEARAAGADGFLPKSEFASRLPALMRELTDREER
jgi:CheY-like chemotaxis protein